MGPLTQTDLTFRESDAFILSHRLSDKTHGNFYQNNASYLFFDPCVFDSGSNYWQSKLRVMLMNHCFHLTSNVTGRFIISGDNLYQRQIEDKLKELPYFGSEESLGTLWNDPVNDHWDDFLRNA